MDLRLVIFARSGVRREIRLRKSQVSIGRERGCDLRLALPLVSRRHCQIAVNADTAQLKDLGSTNGTFRNGQRLDSSVILNAGDQITIGPVTFTVMIDGQPESIAPLAPNVDLDTDTTDQISLSDDSLAADSEPLSQRSASPNASSLGAGGTNGFGTSVPVAPSVARGPTVTADVNPVTATTVNLRADNTGQSDQGLFYAWSLLGDPPAPVSFSVNGSNTTANTMISFTAAGQYAFQVTVIDRQGSSTIGRITVTVAQTPTTMVVNPETVELDWKGRQQFTATAYDQFGALLNKQPEFTWTLVDSDIGSVDGSGLYSAPAGSGSVTVQAACGDIRSRAKVTVNHVAPTLIAAAAAEADPVTGATVQLRAAGKAHDGQADPGAPGLVYTWSVVSMPEATTPPTFSVNGTPDAGITTATFSAPGTYGFQVTITDTVGASITSDVKVQVMQTTTTLAVTPATAELDWNGKQRFTAVAHDQFGQPLDRQPAFTWNLAEGEGGALDKSGIYTAPACSGPATVQAACGDIRGHATVTVRHVPPTVVTPAIADADPVIGKMVRLRAVGKASAGQADPGAPGLVYTWSVTSAPEGAAPPAFSVNGTHEAANTTATFSAPGNYCFQVTITDAAGAGVTSIVKVKVIQTTTTVTVTPATIELDWNGKQRFEATALDQFGIPLARQLAFSWSLAKDGLGSLDRWGLYSAPAGSGSATIQAACGDIRGRATVTVNHAPPTVAAPAVADVDPVSGTTVRLRATGKTQDGHADSTLVYTWSVVSVPEGAAPPTFSVNGTHDAANTTAMFTASGIYSFQVTITDAVGASVTSDVKVNVAQTPNTITVSPAATELDWNSKQRFTATAYDQFNKPLAQQPSFTWTLAGGEVGSLDKSGFYIAPDRSGSATVQAVTGDIHGRAAVTVNHVPPSIVTPAAADADPVTGATVRLRAAGKTPDRRQNDSLVYTWSVTSAPKGATSPTFSVNGTNNAANTTATFTAPGSYSFQVTITDTVGAGVTSDVKVNVVQTTTTLAVTPATAELDWNGKQRFTAVAHDQFGAPLARQPAFKWVLPEGEVGALDKSGVYTAPSSSGAATVHAVCGDISGRATVTVHHVPPSVATPATADADPATGTTVRLSAAGQANDGQADSTLAYHWSLLGTPPAPVTFSVNGTPEAMNTTATFAAPGTYSFQVTITDTAGASVTSNVKVNVVQTTTTLAVTPATAELDWNDKQRFTAIAHDQFGAPVARQPAITWTLAEGQGGTLDKSGVYTAPGSSGSATVQAAVGEIRGQAAVTVRHVPPSVATPATADADPVIGKMVRLSAAGKTSDGQKLVYTWSVTAAPEGIAPPTFNVNGTPEAADTAVTFTAPGTYRFQVTIADIAGASVTSDVKVNVAQTPTTVVVTPSAAELDWNGKHRFTAVAHDQFGEPLARQPAFKWMLHEGDGGALDNSGVYTAPGHSGSATVQAVTGDIHGRAAVTVNHVPPSIVTPAAADADPVIGKTVRLSAAGKTHAGQTDSALVYTWSVTSAPKGATSPTFSVNGTHEAAHTTATFTAPGTYSFQVTITDTAGASVTSNVKVNVVQTTTTLAVTPATAELDWNDKQRFTAIAHDQFGAPVARQPAITWTLAEGQGGTLDKSGVYTAPGSSGSAVVQAACGDIRGQAAVTVRHVPPRVAVPAIADADPVTGKMVRLSAAGKTSDGQKLVYTWSVTAAPEGAAPPTFSVNGTPEAADTAVTFTAPGAYSFQVTITDDAGASVTSDVKVKVVQKPTTITVTPATAELDWNSKQRFAAAAYDQFGAPLTRQPAFTWTLANDKVGSLDAVGVYTAPGSSGSATVQAALGDIRGQATVTVRHVPPSVVAPAIADADPVTGTTVRLRATGKIHDGRADSTLAYTWSVLSTPNGATPPEFSVNGTYDAANTTATFSAPGNYNFRVTITDTAGAGVTSDVKVKVVPTPTTVTVTPATAELDWNGKQRFTAVACDQFGAPMAKQPVFTWSRAEGELGSLDRAGLYSAPASSGSATIHAVFGDIHGRAKVTVNHVPPGVAAPATAELDPATGKIAHLHVTGKTGDGQKDPGAPGLVYTWSVTSAPEGAASPTFSINDAPEAAHTTATFNATGTYNFQVTITDAVGASVTSDVKVNVLQTPTTVAVTPPSIELDWNGKQRFAATVYDQFNQPLAQQPAFTWVLAEGEVGSLDHSGVYTAPGSSGAAMVQAVCGNIRGQAQVTVRHIPPTVAVPATADADPVNGATVHLSAAGKANHGQADSTLVYTWAVSSVPEGAAPPAFSANGTNEAANTTATFSAPGSYSFQVTITDAAGAGVTNDLTVTVAQALTGITVTPAAAALDWKATRRFTAIAYDQFGAPLRRQPTFTWSLSEGSVGSLDSRSGRYTAPTESGSATIRVSSHDVCGSATVMVGHVPPTVVIPATTDSHPVIGSTVYLSAAGQANDGQADSTLAYNWSLRGAPPAPVTFSVNGTNDAANTMATFTAPGTYNFQVTIADTAGAGVTSDVKVNVAQTPTTVVVTPSAAELDWNGKHRFTAVAHDQFGEPLARQPVFKWMLHEGDGGALDNSGVYTAPGHSGSATVQAVTGDIHGRAAVTVNHVPPSIVTPAAADADPVTGATVRLSAAGKTHDGQTDSALAYTWSVTSAPKGATSPTFSVNGTHEAAHTTATFTAPGTYSFQVTITDTAGASVTSNVKVNVVQTTTTLAVTPATAELDWNDKQRFTAIAHDQFGAPVARQPAITWTLAEGQGGTLDKSGVYTAPGSSGSAVVQAACGDIRGQAAVTVRHVPPRVAVPAIADADPVIGTTVRLSATGKSTDGQKLAYTWSVTAAPEDAAPPTFSVNGTPEAADTAVTFTAPGAYSFQVTITDDAGASVTSDVKVKVIQTPTTITVTPATAELDWNGKQRFAAAAYDQFGAPLTRQPAFTWTLANDKVGSLDAAGVYTAPGSSGSATAQAALGDIRGRATITVRHMPPSVVAPAAADADPVTGTTVRLRATGKIHDGRADSTLAYTWSVLSTPNGATPPEFSVNGTYDAANTTATFSAPGNYNFRVTITDTAGAGVTSDVKVKVVPTPTTVTVTPATAELDWNGKQRFTAVACDQFGAPMAKQPVFTWSRAEGELGSLDRAGLYSAPASSGSATIHAVFGDIHGRAKVTVNHVPPGVAAPATAELDPATGKIAHLRAAGKTLGGQKDRTLRYTWSVSSAPEGAVPPTFSANGTPEAAHTIATFNATGTYNFQVTITDTVGASVTSNVNVTVVPKLTTIAIAPDKVELVCHSQRQFTATACDQFKLPLTPQPNFTWKLAKNSEGSINDSGLFSAPEHAGSATVIATGGGIFASAGVSVSSVATTVIAEPNVNPVEGASVRLSATLSSQPGVRHDESQLSYTWSVRGTPPAPVSFSVNGSNDAANTIATFTAVGPYDFEVAVTDAHGATTTGDVTVMVAQALTRIAVIPPNEELDLNRTRQFKAIAFDQFDEVLTCHPAFTWTLVEDGVGSIDQSGLYTAPASPGAAIIEVKTYDVSRNRITGRASVTVARATPYVTTIAPPQEADSPTLIGAGADVATVPADQDVQEHVVSTIERVPSGAGSLRPDWRESLTIRQVLVTGATGFVGRHIVQRLGQGDYQVRTLARRRADDADWKNVEQFEGDVLDPKSLASAMQGCQAVIHLVGIIRPTRTQSFTQAHVTATANVLRTAAAAGVRRYVHMSALGTHAQAVSEYHRTKWQAEELVRASGLYWTIFRPSLILGAGGDFTNLLFASVQGHTPFAPYFGDGALGQRAVVQIQPVYVNDVAEIFVKALERENTGCKTYAVAGPKAMTWPDLLHLVSTVAKGRPKLVLGIPSWLAKGLSRMRVPGLPFTADQVLMAGQDNTADITALREDFAPLTLTEPWQALSKAAAIEH